jgi:hypothetical protein
MRRRIFLVLAATVAAVVWSTTAASGAGPSPGISQGGAGGLKSGNVRYMALPARASTVVQALSKDFRVLRHTTIKGAWGFPLVAYDQTVEGLLRGGRTLLLAQQIYTGDGQLRKTTTFKLVDVKKMKVNGTIELAGAFSFDAVSPDGRYMYLIEYFSSEDPTLYRVRAYDLRDGKLLAKIVADRKSWETGMQGMPVSRTWKEDWAYTLYGGNARPFIHALNTRGIEAVCIDMPWTSSPKRVFDFRLRSDKDGNLVVRGPNGRALVVIDRRSFKILSFVKNP